MILFFGTRPGKSETKNLPKLNCPYCSQIGALTAFISSNFFHIFWIKIFKISSTTIVECNHCKRVYYPDEFTDEMIKAMD